MPQRAHEVVVHPGHRVLVGQALQLGAEQGLLQVGVVQLGVRVGHLHPLDEQLEALGDVRAAGLALRERADGGRVIQHEDRPAELVFHLPLEELILEHVDVLAAGGDARLLGRRLDLGRVVGRGAGVLGQQLVVGLSGKGRREVDFGVAPGELQLLPGRLNRLDDQLLGQVHHRAVVAVGLVGLQHSELGVVARTDSFVAIDAPQLVHPLDPADQQPLQVQLQGDSQVEVDVQGIVVGDEGPGGRPAGDRVQRGALYLEVRFGRQRVADRLDDPGPVQKPREHPLAVDQVQVPHALAQLGVAEPLVLGRRGLDRFAQEMEVLDEDRQLAGPRPLQLAVGADDVAQVEAPRQRPVRLADLLLADEQLDVARPVADVGKDQLAGGALQHDASGGADLGPALLGWLARLAVADRLDDDLRLPGADLADGLVAVEAAAPGVEAELADLLELLASGGLEHVRAAGGFVGWLRGHLRVSRAYLRRRRIAAL